MRRDSGKPQVLFMRNIRNVTVIFILCNSKGTKCIKIIVIKKERKKTIRLCRAVESSC